MGHNDETGAAPPGGGDLGPLADELLRAMGALRRDTRRAAGPGSPYEPLTWAQVELLRLLRRRGGISVAAAAGELRLAANSVSTLVGQLVAAGLVERTRDPVDRRAARLDLTAQARARLEGWRDRRVTAVADGLGRLSAADRGRLAGSVPVLRRLAELVAEGAADLVMSADDGRDT